MRLLRSTFPTKAGSHPLGDGVFRLRFGKACVISFCELWGFLPGYYDSYANELIYRNSIRCVFILCVSTVLKVVTFALFIFRVLTRGQFEVNYGVARRLFMFKLNLFTGFVHLHTAWRAPELFCVTNRMSAGFEQIARELGHDITKKTGTLFIVFFAMLAILSVSTLHPFLMDCHFHFMEEVLGSCRGQRSMTQKGFEVMTQFISGADLCASILPYGIILTEFILMPRELLNRAILVLKKAAHRKRATAHALRTYNSLAVIFSHFNVTFGLFMPALVNFLITSLSYTLGVMILRGKLALPIKITLSTYFALILLRFLMLMDQSSKVSKDSDTLRHVVAKGAGQRNREVKGRVKGLRTLQVQIGPFHAVSTYVMFISLHAVISYTVSLLLLIQQR